MRKSKLLIIILAILAASVAIFFVLQHEKTLVVHPKGVISKGELDLIVTNLIIMLIVIVPTLIALFVVVLKYRSDNPKTKYAPDKTYGPFAQLILWLIPSVFVAVMIFITWDVTHELDPYQPIKSEAKPLHIQVVAIDWKWLFIYPEEGIATVNFVQFPEKTPVKFSLAADDSPMNSFWIPQLSGQIYAMTGMVTPLHIMADGVGEYAGRAAEINGDGYAGMTFIAKSTSQSDFEAWVQSVKKSPLKLTQEVYDELSKASQDHPVTFYSTVEKDLFNKIVMKYKQHLHQIGL